MVQVKVYRESDLALPKYETAGAAGMDVQASEDIIIRPHDTKLVKTGLYVQIPQGYEIQVRPRSGLSLKTDFRVANSPGTVDADYRGELCVIAWNKGEQEMIIKKGDRIGQIVLQTVPQIEWVEVSNKSDLDSTDRGSGGFGSTGK